MSTTDEATRSELSRGAERLVRLGAVQDVARTLEMLAGEVEGLRRHRDERIRVAAAAGDPVREIAEHAGVSVAMAYRIIGQGQ